MTQLSHGPAKCPLWEGMDVAEVHNALRRNPILLWRQLEL